MNYIRFFFGGPRRIVASLFVIGFFISVISPNLFHQGLIYSVNALLCGASKVLAFVLPFVFLGIVIRTILGGGRRRGR